MNPLRYELGSIYDALIKISEDESFTGSSGTTTRAEAHGLATRICNFTFIVKLITWHRILFEVNATSKMLQDKNISIQCAIKQLHHTKEFLENLKNDDS